MGFWREMKDTLVWMLKPAAQKQRLLERAAEVLRLDPETYALYESAKRNGVAIHFDSTMIGGWAGATFGFAQGNGECSIRLRPRENVHEIAEILAHELRHYWQYKTLGQSPAQWSAQRLHGGELSLVFNRVIEADAYAFQMRFARIVDGHDRLSKDMARLLDRQREQNRELAPEHIMAVNKIGAEEWKVIKADAGSEMARVFQKYLLSEKLVADYDIPLALYIHEQGLNTAVNDNTPVSPAASISVLRKAIGGEDLRPLVRVEHETDKAFNSAVLHHIHTEARVLAGLSLAFHVAQKAKAPEADILHRKAQKIAQQLRKQ